MKRRLAADNRLPTIYAAREGVDAGGLMSARHRNYTDATRQRRRGGRVTGRLTSVWRKSEWVERLNQNLIAHREFRTIQNRPKDVRRRLMP
jgi:hypothetical protein